MIPDGCLPLQIATWLAALSATGLLPQFSAIATSASTFFIPDDAAFAALDSEYNLNVSTPTPDPANMNTTKQVSSEGGSGVG